MIINQRQILALVKLLLFQDCLLYLDNISIIYKESDVRPVDL